MKNPMLLKDATHVNLNYRTFLIKPMFGFGRQYLVTDPDEFVQILKDHCKKGIDFVKEYAPDKLKFLSVSKKEILTVMTTPETKNYLENHYYFKK